MRQPGADGAPTRPTATLSLTTTTEPEASASDGASTNGSAGPVTVHSSVQLTGGAPGTTVILEVRYSDATKNGSRADGHPPAIAVPAAPRQSDPLEITEVSPPMGAKNERAAIATVVADRPAEPEQTVDTEASVDAPEPLAEDSGSPLPAGGPPNGGAAATLLAAGLGCALFGLLVILADANERAHTFLDLYTPVGPLSGKSAIAVIGWLVLWAGLHLALRQREVDLGRYLRLTMILVAAGFVGTFPPVYQLFAN